MNGIFARITACALAAGLLAAPAGAAERNDYTPAQLALFDTPHLKNISAPGTLFYDFRHSAAAGAGFDDRVELTVTEVRADGRKNLSVQYLSGERRRSFPAIEGFRGNPLVMLFLQHDVEEMQRLAGGVTSYFRNRIRFAFRDKVELAEITVEHGGRALAATRITIRPFVGDPNQARFQAFVDKWYEFVLAPELPGGIYRIRSVVPARDGGAPLIESSLTYDATGT